MSQVGMSGDLAASETFALRKAIEEFNKQASKQTQQMLRMTNVIARMTGVMTIGVLVQIYLALIVHLSDGFSDTPEEHLGADLFVT